MEQLSVFGRDAPLILEVGCGHGTAAVAYAARHLGHDVVAVDVHAPGVARMLAAADAAGVPNLRVELDDGVCVLEDRIPPGQLAALHLFFPDPWPKNKHAKRRFVSADTLDLLESRLSARGLVLLATDQPAYAAHVVAQVQEHGAFVARPAPRPSWRPVDGFERKALTAGREIIDLRLERAQPRRIASGHGMSPAAVTEGSYNRGWPLSGAERNLCEVTDDSYCR